MVAVIYGLKIDFSAIKLKNGKDIKYKKIIPTAIVKPITLCSLGLEYPNRHPNIAKIMHIIL